VGPVRRDLDQARAHARGDSSYYINNIPVRRRDIHDLFSARASSARVRDHRAGHDLARVEARPEELRVFSRSAGVSKYKERRKETEGRIADTRENLARVEDIRNELAASSSGSSTRRGLPRNSASSKLAQARAAGALVFERQDAVRTRERCGSEIAQLTVALESLQAEVRSIESKLERMRADHYAAGDALHDRQGRSTPPMPR